MASVEVDEFLPHPPERVWQALTDPALLARWLMPNDFKPVIGHVFTFRTEPVPQHGFDGVVHCTVLTLEPPRLMRFTGGRASSTPWSAGRWSPRAPAPGC